jgi:hypothetical protein
MAYPPGLEQALRTALEAVVPPEATEATVQNDTFGQDMIELWIGA